MNNKFKQTSIEKIPKEWGVVSVNKIANWEKGKKPRELITEKKENYMPYLSTESLRDGNYEKFGKSDDKNTVNINCDDIVLLWDGSNAGEIFKGKTGLLSSTMVKLNLIEKEAFQRIFLYYLLKQKEKFIKAQTKGTGIPHVDGSVFRNLKIVKPPLPEQQKIAEILSIVDEGIQKVDEAIKKTQKLKKGLMQKLFTEGICHKEFKETEIGKIPKEWSISQLGENTNFKLIMGQSPPSSSYNKNKEGIPFLQGNADFGDIYPDVFIIYTMKPSKIAEKGDILISVRAPVGDINLSPQKICIGRGLSAVRVLKGNNIFYFYWFIKIKNRLEAISKGSTFKAITKNELNNLDIPVVPFSEQQKIAEILSTVDKKLQLQKKREEKLERIKKGLMQDLLTGKKRVKV